MGIELRWLTELYTHCINPIKDKTHHIVLCIYLSNEWLVSELQIILVTISSDSDVSDSQSDLLAGRCSDNPSTVDRCTSGSLWVIR